jgi:hypothetical protein
METIAIQMGGKLIGQGTYGCVFSQPLFTKRQHHLSQKDKNKVGKITQAVDATTEIQAARVLRAVPNSIDYFLLPDVNSISVPLSPEHQKDPDLKKCEAIERYGFDKMLHFKLSMGGPNLRETLNTLKAPATFPIYSFMCHLFEAGSLLTLHRYVHYDIHSGNILVSKDFVPRLIDFGVAIPIDDLTSENLDWRWKNYAPFFSAEPPEVTLITAFTEGRHVRTSANEIVSQKEGLVDAHKLLGLQKDDQLRELLRFWQLSKTIQQRDWTSFFKMYWTKFDSWAIGSACLKVLRRLLVLPEFQKNPQWLQHKLTIVQVLQGILIVNPYERLDCLEALSSLDPTNKMLEGEGSKWLGLRSLQRGAI